MKVTTVVHRNKVQHACFQEIPKLEEVICVDGRSLKMLKVQHALHNNAMFRAQALIFNYKTLSSLNSLFELILTTFSFEVVVHLEMEVMKELP